ncbi:U32 family peptidase [Clostridium sp. SM-530-WT-3G]|uniref:U32 family peptidase n=1 Tax=Clostridium sp. SM-530-WT-3G TaxID=2725303 RepID=UPI00145FB84E|nr:U32 family peptidase [Clostridium sp. SM-530-WT-3G]NME84373.1 peptidase U32 [Clostridium sp. SM-530-WT-3G]
MKIVAGLGCIDDYIRMVKAGADEVFVGFVPYEWNKKYGTLFPLNRREVLYYNTQINSFEDMKILKKMVDVYKVPVTIAFNYLYYLEEQYEIIAETIEKLKSIGFYEFIIADIALLEYLKERNIDCFIHLSGECAEINRLSINFLNQFNIGRYIFHRKNTIEDIKSCIENNNVKNIQYEAFMLNERCHYTGAFCSSLHCDELSHICQLPYIIGKVDDQSDNFKKVNEKFNKYYKDIEEENFEEDYDEYENNSYILGASGCGICALKRLKDSGVTHLKVVGRGNSIENMERDIIGLRKAIDILNMSEQKNNMHSKEYTLEDNISFEKKIKDEIFCGKCSNECYY